MKRILTTLVIASFLAFAPPVLADDAKDASKAETEAPSTDKAPPADMAPADPDEPAKEDEATSKK